ncbi:olfactory receptor 11H6-like [Hyla sarda]|uniref:olfactory receptor 11H6-like n=1 Tax=Hyla sarda TaxID=327740 RepID=UPI0024C2B1CB|nr:olfactory receptor 11H6-like [Hyla sarda]
MAHRNETILKEFILQGFSVPNKGRFCLFLLVLTIYVVTITNNIFIIVIVKNERRLHKPMYFFICGLSFLEIWYPSVTVPRLLWTLLTKVASISIVGCLIQYYFHFAFGTIENFYLAIMAYDRYVAVCHPLRYLLILRPQVCLTLLLVSWISGCIITASSVLQISSLSFCAHGFIDSYYCDFAPLIRLSCSETSSIEKQFFALASLVMFGCFFTIMVSYACIIRTTMAFPTSSGRRKTFSTCASHLIVVLLFYGTTMFMFVRTTAGDFIYVNKIISVVPSIVTPLLNPLIYTLRNKEVKDATKKLIQVIKR